MDFFQRWASGAVLLHSDAEGSSVGGSCGAYETRRSWITAKHCVPEGVDVYVMRSGFSNELIKAESVSRHDEVDLAVIHLPEFEEDEHIATQVFKGQARVVQIDGGDFVGFGYPMGAEGAEERIIKGHFQRHAGYRNAAGERYYAGEMSVPVPGGFSGAILAYSHAPNEAIAIATTSVESSITVESVEEFDSQGKAYRAEIKKIHSYGISLVLSPHLQWLHSVLPEFDREFEF